MQRARTVGEGQGGRRTSVDWPRLSIAIVGGDEREQEISRLSAATGATVRAFGFPRASYGIDAVHHAGSAREAMANADYALLPVPRGVNNELYSSCEDVHIRVERELFAPLRDGAHIFCGRVTEAIGRAVEGLAVAVHEYDPDRQLMLERAAAIVEGVIELAIANTDVTIHASPMVVVGYGNIGSTLARRLVALGGVVYVAARSPTQRALAYADGSRPISLQELPDLAPSLSMVFSTVPARVVGRPVLERLPRGSLVLDIVPPPERSDLDLAGRLGLRAVWARGLGRRAPLTVGASQWAGIKSRIEEIELAGREATSSEPVG